jgi:hypothetical protein
MAVARKYSLFIVVNYNNNNRGHFVDETKHNIMQRLAGIT